MFPPRPPRSRLPGGSLRHLWWFNPIWPLALMLLSTGLAAYIIPYADYMANWKTPKYLGMRDLEYIFLCVGGFALFGGFVNLAGKAYRPSFDGEMKNNSRLPWPTFWFIFHASFGLTLLAYAIWLALSVSQGLSVADVLAAVHNEPGAVYNIRDKTETLPGITTFTQLEMGMCLLGTLLGFKFGWKRNFRRLVIPMVIVIALAGLRAHFREERIALLEIGIPVALLSLALGGTARWPGYLRWLLALIPFLAPLGLYVFFSAAEYSRSWVNFYQDKGDSSFLWFSFTRLAGYYVTALNNGAAFVQTIGQYDVPFHSLEWFWKFPLVKELFPYQSLSNAEPLDDYEDILKQKLNPELNNPSGVFVIQLDYGFLGGIAFWCLLGVVGMLLYRAFRKGSLTGLMFYPMFYIGLLESPRILYWAGTRVLPTWLMLLMVILIALFAAAGDWRKRRLPAAAAPLPPARAGAFAHGRRPRRGL